MSVTPFKKAVLSPAQERVEAIIEVAHRLGMGGFALAELRTVATKEIEPLVDALRPFAAFADKAEEFVAEAAESNGSPIMPTKDFRLADFKRAQALLATR